MESLHTVSELAKELGIEKHLHLWLDKSLGSQALADRMPNPRRYLKRLEHWWHRVSECRGSRRRSVSGEGRAEG